MWVHTGGKGLSRGERNYKGPENEGTGTDVIAPNLPASFSPKNPFYSPARGLRQGAEEQRSAPRQLRTSGMSPSSR